MFFFTTHFLVNEVAPSTSLTSEAYVLLFLLLGFRNKVLLFLFVSILNECMMLLF